MKHAFHYEASCASLSFERGENIQVQLDDGPEKMRFLTLACTATVEAKLPQVIALTPTREMAIQLAEACLHSAQEGLKVGTFIGGTPIEADQRILRRTCHVVVGTPGRLCALLERGDLVIPSLQTLVLCHAEALIGDTFKSDVLWMHSLLPKSTQVVACMKGPVPSLDLSLKKMMPGFKSFSLVEPRQESPSVRHMYQIVADKFSGLVNLLRAESGRSIVFCPSDAAADELADRLESAGFKPVLIKGSMVSVNNVSLPLELYNFQSELLVTSNVSAACLRSDQVGLVVHMYVHLSAESYRSSRPRPSIKQKSVITLIEASQLNMLQRIIAGATGALASEFLADEHNSSKEPQDRDASETMEEAAVRDHSMHFSPSLEQAVPQDEGEDRFQRALSSIEAKARLYASGAENRYEPPDWYTKSMALLKRSPPFSAREAATDKSLPQSTPASAIMRSGSGQRTREYSSSLDGRSPQKPQRTPHKQQEEEHATAGEGIATAGEEVQFEELRARDWQGARGSSPSTSSPSHIPDPGGADSIGIPEPHSFPDQPAQMDGEVQNAVEHQPGAAQSPSAGHLPLSEGLGHPPGDQRAVLLEETGPIDPMDAETANGFSNIAEPVAAEHRSNLSLHPISNGQSDGVAPPTAHKDSLQYQSPALINGNGQAAQHLASTEKGGMSPEAPEPGLAGSDPMQLDSAAELPLRSVAESLQDLEAMLRSFPQEPVRVRAKEAPAPSLLAGVDLMAGKDMTDAEIEAAIVARHYDRVTEGGVEAGGEEAGPLSDTASRDEDEHLSDSANYQLQADTYQEQHAEGGTEAQAQAAYEAYSPEEQLALWEAYYSSQNPESMQTAAGGEDEDRANGMNAPRRDETACLDSTHMTAGKEVQHLPQSPGRHGKLRDSQSKDVIAQLRNANQSKFWNPGDAIVDEEGFVKVPISLLQRYYDLESQFWHQ